MVKSLFSLCLLIVASLAWSGVHAEQSEIGFADLAAVHDSVSLHDAPVAAVSNGMEHFRSTATVTHAVQWGEGHRPMAVARVIGSGSSGMQRIGVSTTASNPPDI